MSERKKRAPKMKRIRPHEDFGIDFPGSGSAVFFGAKDGDVPAVVVCVAGWGFESDARLERLAEEVEAAIARVSP